jgi:PIN domain nuclease of toxin-antitoxin system
MALLADIHVFLWFLRGDSRLGERARRQLVDPNTQVLVSAAAFWEIAIEFAAGNLGLDDPPDIYLPVGFKSTGFRELPINMYHAIAVSRLPLHHKDPFDRIMIAQAQLEGLTLVTADDTFSRYDVAVLDARK